MVRGKGARFLPKKLDPMGRKGWEVDTASDGFGPFLSHLGHRMVANVNRAGGSSFGDAMVGHSDNVSIIARDCEPRPSSDRNACWQWMT